MGKPYLNRELGEFDVEDSEEDLVREAMRQHPDNLTEREEFCHYCGEPLEDGLCSASCDESADDEGRETE